MAKNLKVSDADKAAIEKLFKDGLEAAMKNPKKFWDARRDRESEIKPYSKLSAKPLLKLPSRKPGAKRESLVDDMRTLLSDLNKRK